MDFEPQHWLDILSRNPVLIVIGGGLLIGMGVTQAVKKTWLAFGDPKVITVDRYRVSLMWLAMLSTYVGTYMLWHSIIHEEAYGLARAVSLAVAIPSPLFYRWAKAGIAWKFPNLAEKLGDNGAFTK